jgi:FkbM family methyltransferase
MYKTIDTISRKFMLTESEWNPKVILGRAIVAVLPEKSLHQLKKAYYAYLLSHTPEDWGENDKMLVKSLVRPGDIVLDIGASIGDYTKFLSDIVGPSGRVYSFEPNPDILDFLSHNVRKLGLANVELFNFALSDKQGSAEIVIPRYRWGSECHYDATLEQQSAGPDCRRIKVAVDTLDSALANREGKISFIKCDVNSHELPFLHGSLQTIRRSKPAILIEILADPDQAEAPAAQVFEVLEAESYLGYWFDGEALRKRRRGERCQNYFFLTPSHINQLPPHVLR